jgi:hypothetical protein
MADQALEYLLLVEQEKADKRLELLRRVEEFLQSTSPDCAFEPECPLCEVSMIFNDETETWLHAPDCELARVLGEQPADTEDYHGEGVA